MLPGPSARHPTRHPHAPRRYQPAGSYAAMGGDAAAHAKAVGGLVPPEFPRAWVPRMAEQMAAVDASRCAARPGRGGRGILLSGLAAAGAVPAPVVVTRQRQGAAVALLRAACVTCHTPVPTLPPTPDPPPTQRQPNLTPLPHPHYPPPPPSKCHPHAPQQPHRVARGGGASHRRRGTQRDAAAGPGVCARLPGCVFARGLGAEQGSGGVCACGANRVEPVVAVDQCVLCARLRCWAGACRRRAPDGVRGCATPPAGLQQRAGGRGAARRGAGARRA